MAAFKQIFHFAYKYACSDYDVYHDNISKRLWIRMSLTLELELIGQCHVQQTGTEMGAAQ
jgi:hypothetical protein